MSHQKPMDLKRLCYTALTGAISYVLMLCTTFPIFAAAPYLKVELSEIPLLLIAALFSPTAGLLALLTKDTLYWLFTGANIFGIFADIIAGGAFIWLFAAVLRQRFTVRSVLLASAVSIGARVLLSIPVNLVVLYFEFGTPPAAVMASMPFILPFNAIKSGVGVLGFSLVYKRLAQALRQRERTA